jgi:hypothetical protein
MLTNNVEDRRDRNELSRIVRELVARLEELQRALPASSSHAWLADQQQQLIAIAIVFVDLKTNHHQQLYAFVHRLPERLAMVDQVVDCAHKAARLFERFAQRQESFRRVTAQLAIATLIAALRSLDSEP